MEINKMIGSCGLACMLCSAKLNGKCEGCTKTKADNCNLKACSMKLGIRGCYECDKFPCEKETFKHKRVCAFIKYARDMGVEKLIENLKINNDKGIKYHKEDGSKGDYDILESEEEIINLIKQGRYNE